MSAEVSEWMRWLQNEIEKVLFRRALEHKLEGYTLETSQEITEQIARHCPSAPPRRDLRGEAFEVEGGRLAVYLETAESALAATPSSGARSEEERDREYDKFWDALTLKGDPLYVPNKFRTGFDAGWDAARSRAGAPPQDVEVFADHAEPCMYPIGLTICGYPRAHTVHSHPKCIGYHAFVADTAAAKRDRTTG